MCSRHRTTVASYRSGGPDPRRGPSSPRPRRPPPSQKTVQIVMREYAVPALGVFAVATVLAPAIGAIFGLAMAVAAVVTAFSLSWLLVPVLLMFGGLPLLFGGGMVASAFAGLTGVLLFPALIQFGLVATALWLGASVARSLWFPVAEEGYDDGIDARDAVVDVSASTLDDLDREMEAEAARRAGELREFDELLRRRERFQRGGDGPY